MLLLIVHVLFGVVSLAAAVASAFIKTSLMKAVYFGSIGGMLVTGIGLVTFGGANLTRMCFEGGATLAIIIVLRKYSERFANNKEWRKRAEL